MPEAPSQPALLPSLGRLARGLSALFWGLPLTLLVCFQTARTDWLHSFGVLPPLVTTGLLVYALWMMRGFQRAERGWRHALDRALFVGCVNCCLSPFLYWWSRAPGQPFFQASTALLSFSGIIFLSHVNVVLARLGALLPDETLQQETRQFTAFNRATLTLTFVAAVLYLAASNYAGPIPFNLAIVLAIAQKLHLGLIVLLVLAPLALTMALAWKAKEVILASVFQPRR